VQVGGSLAVLLATLATLSYGSTAQRLVLAGLVAMAEGLTRDYDNLGIAAIVILGYTLL
jgi:hypothetical protein